MELSCISKRGENMTEEKKIAYKKLIAVTIAVAVIVIVLFAPLIPVEVTYSETEPYDRSATYVVDNWNLEEKLGWFDVYVQSDVTVRNTDEYGGTFRVVHKLYDIKGLFGSVDDSFYLGAGDSYTSTATFDTTWGQDTAGNYDVTPPTVTDTHLVEKTKIIYKSIIVILLYG